MSSLPLFLNQSRHYLELNGSSAEQMTALRGSIAERYGFPILLAAFALTALLALAQNS